LKKLISHFPTSERDAIFASTQFTLPIIKQLEHFM